MPIEKMWVKKRVLIDRSLWNGERITVFTVDLEMTAAEEEALGWIGDDPGIQSHF
jgi:hypothetical protein